MRTMIARGAVAALAATALAGSLAGSASAQTAHTKKTASAQTVHTKKTASAQTVHTKKTVYSQKAKPTTKSIRLDAGCNFISNGRKKAGQACFKKNGDRVWIRDTARDGMRIEVRGSVNSKGQPGYRCYGNYKGGWQVCNFDRKMAEGHVFLWYVNKWKGNKLKGTSDEKMMVTS
ncbi:hypothetical protein [Streptomyces decoyicus]|uniref:hypothetical protein n=1 Tax=Streptomyces decoyicus TaxID=249567 RepID=UPI000AE7DED2|nr:hypothetical protein [Streptomyces decoyicus]QZY16154.1 hypothetical protein K7C20_13530 [Streptomyces decoyicus]